MHHLYKRWIEYVFDRPETPNGWYFDLDIAPFESESSPVEITKLVTSTCLRAGTDLQSFSNNQVAAGLDYIFSNSCSDVVFSLRNQSVPLSLRMQCIDSLWSLYTECYQKRCCESLSHRNEGLENSLNVSCYMLWDVTPLGYWEGDPEKKSFYSAVVKLLKRTLQIPHLACIESALHGLGHLHRHAPQGVEEAIDSWLLRTKNVRQELTQYAQAARVGYVL